MTFPGKPTLGKKITLLTALGLFLVVAIFSATGIRAVDQATEIMLQDRLTTAHLVADYIDEALGRALFELKTTAQMIESNGTKSELEHQIEDLEKTYSRLSIYTNSIYLLSEEGQIIWSKPESPGAVGIDISSYPSLSETLRKDESSISGLVLTPMAETPVVLLSSPTKESKGILVVTIDPGESSIGGFVQPISLGQTGYVEIVDQSGIVVARTEPGPKTFPFEKSDHSSRFAALITTGEPTRGVCHTCHELEQKVERKDVLAFVPLLATKWGVVIRQAEEEALAPARELRQSLLLFAIGLVTVAFLLVVTTTRDVVSRIKMLTAASQRIAKGDLISPVTTLGKDEVGILAQTLDDMRTKLKTSYEELEQLHQDVKRKEEIRGELLQSLFSIQEEERKRIARELHDETTQVITSLSANLEAATGMLPDSADKTKAVLRKIQKQSISILDEILRLIYELRPAMFDDLGLVAAIEWLAEDNLEKAGIIVHLKTTGRAKRLGTQLETVLFRAIQEIVHNITRHADAKSAHINLHFKKSVVRVHVTDDGRGFDVEEAMNTKARPRGLGLLGMKERVELVKGSLCIRSRSGGGGTEINIEIPLS